MRRLQMRQQTPLGVAVHAEPALSGALLRANVDRLFGSPLYRPPMLPTVALRVLEQSRRSNASYSEVVSLIESDPLFSASVLKIASSPMYASKSALRSIDQALLRMGLARLVDVCLEVALTARVFRAPGFERVMERVRRHSVAVGHVARLVAERTGAVGDDTFTLGLLHEVGVVAGLITLSTQALWPEGLPKGDHIPLVVDERGSLTDKLVRAWCLPDSIARGLSDLGRGSPPTDAGLASVIVANRLAELIGFAGANEAVHAAESEAEQQARELLGLRLIDLSELESVSKRLCSRMVC